MGTACEASRAAERGGTCRVERVSDVFRPGTGSAAGKAAAGLAAGGNGGAYAGRSCGDAGFAVRYVEIAMVRGQNEISEEIAMLCEKYKDALIEAAAGAAVPGSLREHLDTCAGCRARLDAQETVFAMVDAGLRSRTNVGVPANFDHRVRAASEVHVSPKGRRHSSVVAFGSMAAAAAVALATILTHNPDHGRKEMPPSAGAQTEVSASHSTAARSNNKELEPPSRQSLYLRSSVSNVRQRLNGAALGIHHVHVLDLEGQEELLVNDIDECSARNHRLQINVRVQFVADMNRIEVLPREFS